MNEVFVRVRDMLVFSRQVEEVAVSKCSRLVEDLGCDSMDLLEFAAECEEEFGVDIPNRELEKFATVGDAVTFVQACLSKVDRPASMLL